MEKLLDLSTVTSEERDKFLGVSSKMSRDRYPTLGSLSCASGSVAPNQIWQQRIDGRTFAEVIKGDGSNYHSMTTIKVEETGNEWLYESIILRLKTPYSAMQVRKELMNKGEKDILVWEGGGRDVIISFKSKEEMMSKVILLKSWFTDWCEYITEWRTEMYLQQERCVWVTCYGVPPNLWNPATFRKIGQLWGEVVLLTEDVCSPKSFRCGRCKIVTNAMNPINTSLNLECKGRIYPIRVLEEPSSVEGRSSSAELHSNGTTREVFSNIHGGLPLPADRRLDRDDANKAVDVALSSNVEADKAAVGGSLSHVSAVEETKDGAGFSNETGVGVVESSLPVPVGSTVHVPYPSQGFLKSLSQPFNAGPGIQLEIALGGNAFGPQPFGPSSSGLKVPSIGPIYATTWEASQTKSGANLSPINSSSNTQRLKKGKRKWSKREGLKHCLLAGKFSGFARRIVQSGATSNKGPAKSFKSGTAVAALPVSPHNPYSQHSPDRGPIQEAQSTLQMGQRLGLDSRAMNLSSELLLFHSVILQILLLSIVYSANSAAVRISFAFSSWFGSVLYSWISSILFISVPSCCCIFGFASCSYLNKNLNWKTNGTKFPREQKRHDDLQHELLSTLFHFPNRSEEISRETVAINAVKRSKAFRQVVVEPLRDTTVERKTANMSPRNDIEEDGLLSKYVDEGDNYLVLRKAVKEYRATMKEYYKAAIEAFAQGDHARASKLLEEGQFFHGKAREADEESAQMITQARNGETEDTVSLDLHNQGDKEAIRLLKCHLSSLSGISSMKYLKVIVETNGEDVSKRSRNKRLVRLYQRVELSDKFFDLLPQREKVDGTQYYEGERARFGSEDIDWSKG
ncbi:hypothetical protein TEA_009088 [Camellia sinensis var. sinensis]|uniref:DUF1771 domain-containing protein n=1 Tax=Camellia sinensis var. sinensis TaxID=542762 RepID=A0A4S4DLC1_CAMSN|nr:hypothetical protein TEA_009088 [Camellia sinensis var. sinensis]